MLVDHENALFRCTARILLVALSISAVDFSLYTSAQAQTSGLDWFQRGIQAYDAGDFQTVITAMQRALQPGGQLTQWAQVDAYKYMGIANARLGRNADAENAFRRLCALNPQYELGEAVGPEALNVFNRIRSGRGGAKGGKGWLKIVIPSLVVAGGAAAGVLIIIDKGGPLVGPPPSPPPR